MRGPETTVDEVSGLPQPDAAIESPNGLADESDELGRTPLTEARKGTGGANLLIEGSSRSTDTQRKRKRSAAPRANNDLALKNTGNNPCLPPHLQTAYCKVKQGCHL